ncbi:hypothetical protein I4U23_001321 [Adineta vaga]|nr:hypothetical protein I4U23_001321 [Adineta vaga]
MYLLFIFKNNKQHSLSSLFVEKKIQIFTFSFTMQQVFIIFVTCYMISIVNGCSQYCNAFKNKVYQLKITLPDKEPFYALMDFQDECKIHEFDNIANGGSKAEIGFDLTLGTHVGFYACHSRKYVHITTSGYIYQTPDVPELEDNGAIAVHDIKLNFSKDRKTCHGSMEFAFYETGSDPFDSDNTAKLSVKDAKVTCQLLRFRAAEHKNYS